MSEYIVHETGYPGTIKQEIVQELVRCKDCKWGKERCGNIECNVDMNEPSEYHGYEWFCPCGERREDEKRRKRTDSESCTENA